MSLGRVSAISSCGPYHRASSYNAAVTRRVNVTTSWA